ncbi:MAG: hypothetical protein HOV81_18085 [Kofleriaceae bacterium]|nr:hypothetical protein [Kofleriaceae bacterium]
MRGWCVLAIALAACGDEPDALVDGMFTDAEWAQIQTFTPIGEPPPNPTNRYADDERAARFGQRLFNEKRYSGPLAVASDLGEVGETGKIACASCHRPNAFFTDTRSDNAKSFGAARTRRNAPSLVNVVFYEWGNWGGAHDQFWKQAANSPETSDNTAGTRLAFAHVVYDHYRDAYNELFPIPLDPALDSHAPDAARFPRSGKPKPNGAPDGPWESMTPEDREIVNTIMANCGKSIEAYERRLISRNAPFDRYVAGDPTAITAAAKRGLALFIGKAACDECHTGPTFTDQAFHVTGVVQTIDPIDNGRYDDIVRVDNTFNGAGPYSDDPVAGAAKIANLVQTEDLKGRFRTKSLRHLTETAPYFHDGSAATLDDVVRFYNQGGGEAGFAGVKDPRMVPIGLSESEIADLVAFLESLTGEPVTAELARDTSAP